MFRNLELFIIQNRNVYAASVLVFISNLLEIPYEITVWTGDIQGAGTDANVSIQMYGESGKSVEYKLRNKTDNFQQCEVDKFKVDR